MIFVLFIAKPRLLLPIRDPESNKDHVYGTRHLFHIAPIKGPEFCKSFL